jgi:hypothetical protein
MSPKQKYLADALAYAKERWCWDDVTFITEMFEGLDPPRGNETPGGWIDAMAFKFDLLDPRDYEL